MKHKIALLADVHGNISALSVVIADAKKEEVTDYWFLGDLIMPGPGSYQLLELLQSVNTSVFMRGNWEETFFEVLRGDLDYNDASDVYAATLVKYQCQNLSDEAIKFLYKRPMHSIKNVNGLKISLSHHLPDKNYGGELSSNQGQQNFDRLFENNDCDLAIYAHVHHQMMRYSSSGQLILNPGSIGQPFSKWQKFSDDLRAQYSILEIDDEGVAEVQFKRVVYDKKEELQLARFFHLPYFELYEEQLTSGKVFTHNKEILEPLNQKYGYRKETEAYFHNHVIQFDK